MPETPDTAGMDAAQDPWARACRAAALFAVAPTTLGGVVVRSAAGPVRDAWLALLRGLLADFGPVRVAPAQIGDDRLIGGLDLSATLHTGRPVLQRGLLAEADGGVVILPMAERAAPGAVARLAAALDQGGVSVERDGLSAWLPARFGLVAMDEGIGPDERVSGALADRCAFSLNLDGISVRAIDPGAAPGREAVVGARNRFPRIDTPDAAVRSVVEVCQALGIGSARSPLLALTTARIAAALDGAAMVSEAHLSEAAGLVLAPRATCVPVSAPDDSETDETPPEEPARSPDDPSSQEDEREVHSDELPEDVVLAAALAAIPPDLLAGLPVGQAGGGQTQAGRAGVERLAKGRGRPAGLRARRPDAGMRLNLIETLRAAAPWQRLRAAAGDGPGVGRILVRAEDFRVTRLKHRGESLSIFVVDASGSAAFQRLAEAKGAVELLLAESYVRRDHVAMIAFRGAAAELVLPPTRSLVRAKRSLAQLPGGGATPVASAVLTAYGLAEEALRRGQTPTIVFLTDGRGNVALSGEVDRGAAREDTTRAAQALAALGCRTLVVDTSPRAGPAAADLAAAMRARYLPLPRADAAALSAAVRQGTGRDAGDVLR